MWRKRSEKQHGVEAEPHWRGGPVNAGVGDRLDEEPSRSSRIGDEHVSPDYAVSDEPALTWKVFDRNASPGYGEYVAERMARTPLWRKWLAVMGAAIVAGPFAVFGAFYQTLLGEGGFGYLAIVVVGPALEEMLKIACVLWFVERRPWLLPGAAAIVGVGAAAGLSFAAIENWMYLNVYFPDHEQSLVIWRWTAGVALHTTCSIIAAIGVARMWRAVLTTGRPAEVSTAFGWILAAIIIHGAYNALAIAMAMAGIGP